MTIGDRIKRIRKKRRLTQAELAMMSGLSLSAIQGYEQGRYEPKRKSIESIAEVFKIPVDELYDMPAELSTNLAEVGTDCISRQAAIDALHMHLMYRMGTDSNKKRLDDWINGLPSAHPEIIYCKDCKYWNSGSCECHEYVVNNQDYMVGDIETEAEHFCGYADMREVTE